MGLSLMDANKIVAELKGDGDFELLAFLFYLVEEAAIADMETPFGRLKAGQVAKSVRGIAEDFRLSKSTIHRRLANLIRIGAVSIERESKRFLITLQNYGDYLKDKGLARPASASTPTPPPPPAKPHKKEKAEKKAVVFAEDSPPYTLASLLAKFIRIRNPTAKLPNLQSWAAEADRLHRLDGRDWAEAEAVLRYSQKHQFWQMNVLSIEKFRKHYDRLNMEMRNDKPSTYKDGNKPSLKTASDKREHRFREVVSKYS